ncbi:MAG: hypothetical protein ACK53L_15040, partial [Pirellulaceae bacterium]
MNPWAYGQFTLPPTVPTTSTSSAMPNAVPGQAMPAQRGLSPEIPTIQLYNLPAEMVGAIGAQLRVLYHDPDTSITTEPGTGRLMVMAMPQVQREIAARVELIQKQVNAGGS